MGRTRSVADVEDPRVAFQPPSSSRPGVALHLARLEEKGAGTAPFQGGRFTVEPGRTSRPDNHAVRECWMVAAGTGVLRYDDRELRISASDFLMFEPHRTHRVHNDGDETLVIHTVWWGGS